MRPSGRSALVALLFALAGCWYGFAGGGLPEHIRTVAVVPFENETSTSAVQTELHDLLRRDIERRLGLRDATESRADAVVRGTIVRYEEDIPIAFSTDPRQATTARRRLQLVVDVEIVDQSTGRALWTRKSLSAEGDYGEREETEGRRRALEKIVNDIIEGAQSQW